MFASIFHSVGIYYLAREALRRPLLLVAYAVIFGLAWLYTGWRRRRSEDKADLPEPEVFTEAQWAELKLEREQAEGKACELQEKLSAEDIDGKVSVVYNAARHPTLKIDLRNEADRSLACRLAREVIGA